MLRPVSLFRQLKALKVASLLIPMTLCLSIIWCSRSAAEYRAYLLEITSPSGVSQQVTSTLDAHQYTAYYHLPIESSIVLKDHWMCYGRTSEFKPICPPPKSNIKSSPQSSPTSKK